MSPADDEIDPFIDPSGTSGELHANGLSFEVSRGVELTLASDSLIVHDDNISKKQRLRCCAIPCLPVRFKKAVNTIPYHSILDANHDSTTLSITYARSISRRIVRPTTLNYPLSKTAELSAPTFVARLLTYAYPHGCIRRKRIKLLINPFGGKGHAKQIYTRDIEPISAAARCEVDVEVTTHSGHAGEIAETIDVDAFDVIACCSGDGLPHEVFNGLGRRADGRRALAEIAVVLLPCGTGNAMSLNEFGTSSPSLAALAMVKGIPMALDLASVTQGERRALSFLSQAVGICAEADLDTEHLRWMGDARFTYGLLVRLMGKTVYPCDIAVDIVEEDKEKIRARWQETRSDAAAQTTTKSSGSMKTLFDHPASRMSESTPKDNSPLPPLPFDINAPLPKHWTSLPSPTLGSFYAGLLPLISSSTLMFPYALPNDGCLDIVIMNGNISRITAVKALLGVETGSHVHSNSVTYLKVRAYRVTPKQRTGSLSVDGERLPFLPFQVEVHPGLGRTLTKSGCGFEEEVK